MYPAFVLILCCAVGHIAGYNVQRELPYNTGPNDPIEYNGYEPSQRLFWSNSGSNQVGGTGFWAHLTNKFPFLNRMFGRMEVEPEYGVPGISHHYDVPNAFNPQSYQPQYYQMDTYPTQFSQTRFNQPRFNQDQFRQFVPSTRDVGFTDDAVIITPPQVPIAPQRPVVPIPDPEPAQGYHYNKPQYRLELPHK